MSRPNGTRHVPSGGGGAYFHRTLNTMRRDAPCENTLQPLVTSWARTLESMPVLAQARLAFEVETLLNMADATSDTSVED
ncbi:hypothetical protein F4803DRAFT_529387 [Xylaria telfairii]|nr:hypothetical protein F4803DRAFT_529387 [Xylaria telfairii]